MTADPMTTTQAPEGVVERLRVLVSDQHLLPGNILRDALDALSVPVKGEGLGSSAEGADTHRAPVKSVLDIPVMWLLLDYLDGRQLTVPASEAPTMKDAAAAIRHLGALVDEHRAGEAAMGRWMDGMQDLLADCQQATVGDDTQPGTEKPSGFGVDHIADAGKMVPGVNNENHEALREKVARIIIEWPEDTDFDFQALKLADAILAALQSGGEGG